MDTLIQSGGEIAATVGDGDILSAACAMVAAYGIVPFVNFLKYWIPAKFWFVAPELIFLLLSGALVFNANTWLDLNYSISTLVAVTLSMDKLATIIQQRGVHEAVVAKVSRKPQTPKEGE